ncbi:hypothetical protein DPMN_128472 [Dreissena polymorpha]|uniref:Uncharacterized protein n=1 Tax=Dreissena polymorpha TaxID=45954 RepID=A0A9D4JWG6_DREPO|nr:hypothetical protein DPMN_128472 [Dreissena polymorpha]
MDVNDEDDFVFTCLFLSLIKSLRCKELKEAQKSGKRRRMRPRSLWVLGGIILIKCSDSNKSFLNSTALIFSSSDRANRVRPNNNSTGRDASACICLQNATHRHASVTLSRIRATNELQILFGTVRSYPYSTVALRT